MRIETRENEIIIRETPAILWFIGLFFASIGAVFVYGALGGFKNSQHIPHWQITLTLLMGSAGVAVGIWAIIRAPVLKLTIDRRSKLVSIDRLGLSGRTKQSYSFDEIEHFFLLRGVDDEGDSTWAFALRKTDGDVEQITSLALHSEDFERKFVFTVNEFMHKQLPAAQMVIESDEPMPALPRPFSDSL